MTLEEAKRKIMIELDESGEASALENITDYEVKLPDIKISVKKGKENMISTQVINGKKYVLIDATEGVEVNGVTVKIDG